MIETHDLKLQVNYVHKDKHGNIKSVNGKDTGLINESTVTLTVKNANGQETDRREYPFRSFITHLLPFLVTRMQGGFTGTGVYDLWINDIENINRPIYGKDDDIIAHHDRINFMDFEDTVDMGMVIGSGNSPVTPTDYKLDNITTTATRGSYTLSDIEYSSGYKTSFFTLTNTFTNQTENPFNIQEVGMYAGDGSERSLMARDVFDNAITVNVNSVLTIDYKISFAASEDLGFAYNFVKLFHGALKGDSETVGATVDVTDIYNNITPVVPFNYATTSNDDEFNHFNIKGVDATQLEGGIRAYSEVLIPSLNAINDIAFADSNTIAKVFLSTNSPHSNPAYSSINNNISISETLTNVTSNPFDIKYLSVCSIKEQILLYHKVDPIINMLADDALSVEFKLTIA